MGNKKVKEQAGKLSDDEILKLANASGYSFESVKKYYESFIFDCPTGRLSRKQFREIYQQLYPNSRSTKFCDRIFKIFDYSERNYLDFGEFLSAITITINGTTTQKLTCAFKIYDLNSDGKLDKKELKQILSHIHEMLGENRLSSSKIAEKQVNLIFKKFDISGTETLTLDQFIAGCLRDDYLGSLFTNGDGILQKAWNSNESLASSQADSGGHKEKLQYLKDKFHLFK